MRRLLCLLLALALPACATVGADEPRAVSGAAVVRYHAPSEWRELKSEHFTLTTDLSPRDAPKVLGQLEKLRTALLTTAWGKVKLEGEHTDVIVLRTHGELTEFSDENVAGYMFHGERPLLVGYGQQDLESQQVFAHELAHAISRRLLQRQPLWFAEGLAKFLETVHLREDGVAEVGNADLNTVTMLNRRGRLPIARVLAFTGKDLDGMEGSEVAGFYRTSWLLVHDLFNQHGQAFRHYQVALAQGRAPEAAWAENFGDLTPEKLDQELTLYLRYGQYRLLQVPQPPEKPLEGTVRELSEAEVHAVRAELFLTGMGQRTRDERVALAKAELAPAQAAAPDDPRVLEVSEHWTPAADALVLAHAAVQKHPDDGRAWRVLCWALSAKDAPEPQKAERLKAFARAAELEPGDATTLNDWAWTLATTGHPEQALGPARRAASLNPDPAVLDTLAVTLAELGQCPDALATEQRAVDLVPPEIRGRREGLAQHQAEMLQHCVAK